MSDSEIDSDNDDVLMGSSYMPEHGESHELIDSRELLKSGSSSQAHSQSHSQTHSQSLSSHSDFLSAGTGNSVTVTNGGTNTENSVSNLSQTNGTATNMSNSN